jgi:hypothetical protein
MEVVWSKAEAICSMLEGFTLEISHRVISAEHFPDDEAL